VARIGRRLGLEEWPVTRKQWFEALRRESPLYADSRFDALYGEDGSPGVPLGGTSRLGFCAPSPPQPAAAVAGFPMAVAFAAHPAGWSTGALSLREELLRRECPESTLAVNPQDLKAAGLKPGWPAKLATPGGEVILTAQEDGRLSPGVMVVVPVPGTPAAALRGLLPADEGAALATQPVPARLERPSP
jgi:anaerobic selenocysteine-containing dehydrogenase